MNWFELVPIAFVAIVCSDIGIHCPVCIVARARAPMSRTIPDRNARSSRWREPLTGTREHKLKLSAFGWCAVPLDQLTGPLRWISSIISC